MKAVIQPFGDRPGRQRCPSRQAPGMVDYTGAVTHRQGRVVGQGLLKSLNDTAERAVARVRVERSIC
jgi:hypothetical protein